VHGLDCRHSTRFFLIQSILLSFRHVDWEWSWFLSIVAKLKEEIAYFDSIVALELSARGQFPADFLAVDESVIAAFQILDEVRAVLRADFGVFAADGVMRYNDLTSICIAADYLWIAAECYHFVGSGPFGGLQQDK
jgi:hypothetical protein